MTTEDPEAERPDGAQSESEDDNSLSEDERAELRRLRAASLAMPRRQRHRLRWTGAAILVALTAILLLATVSARFARSEIFDTDRYVATVAPLASNPAIQNELADRLTDAIVTHVDIEGLTAQAISALTKDPSQVADQPRIMAALNNLPPLVAAQAASFIHQTAQSLVAGDEFAQAWTSANRLVHESLVGVLTGQTRPGVEVDASGTVSLSLQPILATVREKLDERGFTFSDRIPDLDARFVLFEATDLPRAQHVVRALDRAANILPWVTVGCAIGAVRLAPGGFRLRVLALTGLAGVVSMVVLGIGLVVARGLYLESIPPETVSPDTAKALFDTVTTPLRTSMRAIATLALCTAIAAYLAGSSQSARSVRAATRRVIAALARGRGDRMPTATEDFAAEYRTPLRVAVLAGATLALMFWPYPTAMVVVGIAAVTGLLLLILETVARSAPEQRSGSRSAT